MKLEAKDKLLFNMLCDIYEHLGIEDRLDPDLIREAVSSDNTWALAWKYEGIFSSSDIETPAIVQEVADILEMWEILEQSFEELSPADRQLLVEKVGSFGENVQFFGFCHNNEPEQCQILRMLVKQMGLWEHFANRKFHSVPHSLGTYQRMLTKFRPIHEMLLNSGGYAISVDSMATILLERVHPDNRKAKPD